MALTSQTVKIITVVLTLSAFFYKSLTQRSPLYLLTTPPPPLPDSHSCKVHHPDILHNCKDFSRLPGTPYIVLSCDQSRREWYHALSAFPASAARGEIFMWDPSHPSVAPTLLSTAESLGKGFHPLGISAVARSPSITRLFITNQASRGASVEVLDVDLHARTATHWSSLRHSGLSSPVAIAAVNATVAFVANDAFFSRRWRTGLLGEMTLGVPGGSVVRLSTTPDGKAVADVARVARVSFATGMAVDRGSGKLYVSSGTHGVYSFVIDPSTGGVVAEAFVRTPFAADGLHVDDARGELYVSGIPDVRAFFTNLMGNGPLPGSWVVRLLPAAEGAAGVAARGRDMANVVLRKEEWRWKSVFWDDGRWFGGVSTAGVVDVEGAFVGVSGVADGVVVCERALEVAYGSREGGKGGENEVGRSEL